MDSPSNKQSAELALYKNTAKFRKKLSKDLGTKVTGQTHEGDHQLAVQSLTGGLLKRKNKVVKKQIEATAPTILIPKKLHRKHITTGSSKKSTKFRKQQHSLAFNEGQYSSAVQLSFAEYAHQEGFQDNTPAHKVMDRSFSAFRQLDKTSYLQSSSSGPVVKHRSISNLEREELALSWQAARTGIWPSQKDFLSSMKRVRRFKALPSAKELRDKRIKRYVEDSRKRRMEKIMARRRKLTGNTN